MSKAIEKAEIRNVRKGVREMNGYCLRIEVKDREVEKILKRLQTAQEEIYNCYNDLINLGILQIAPVEKG